MSPAMQNFFHEFAAAAQALEDLPKAQERVKELEADREEYRQSVTRLESRIIELKNELDAANTAKRAAEAARDEASFRLLEVEDAFGKVASMVGSALGAVDGVNKILNPPKPVEAVQVQPEEPVVHHEPMPVDGLGEEPGKGDVVRPTEAQPSSTITGTEPVESATEGQSADPLPTSGASTSNSGSDSGAGNGMDTTADATATSDRISDRYAGRVYSEVAKTFWQDYDSYVDAHPDYKGLGTDYWQANGGSVSGWSA